MKVLYGLLIDVNVNVGGQEHGSELLEGFDNAAKFFFRGGFPCIGRN